MDARYKIAVLILLLILGAETVNGWSDHFTIDTSSDYTCDIPPWVWDTGNSRLWNQNSPYTGSCVYDVEIFGSGIYYYDYIDTDQNEVSSMWYGADLTLDNGYAIVYSGGNGYVHVSKFVSGVGTSLTETKNIPNGAESFEVEWDQITGKHIVKMNSTEIFDITDFTYSDDGYMGVKQSGPYWSAYDELSFTPSEPTPTPTPTPTPPPILSQPCDVSCVSINETGKDYIIWYINSTLETIFLDNIEVNATNCIYFQTNLEPDSKHFITAYNLTNNLSCTVETNTEVNTSTIDYIISMWFIPVLGFVIICIGLYLKSPALPFIGLCFVLFNLTINHNNYTDIENMFQILVILFGILVFEFKWRK